MEESKTAKNIKEILKSKGYKVVTAIRELQNFYPAEDYHQDYYATKGGTAYCHIYNKKF